VTLGYVVISFLQMQLMFILIQRLTLYTVYVWNANNHAWTIVQ